MPTLEEFEQLGNETIHVHVHGKKLAVDGDQPDSKSTKKKPGSI